MKLFNYIKEKIMGRPRKNQTLTTLTTEPTEEQTQALDTLVSEGEALDLYSSPDREPLAFTAEPKEVPLELNNLALSIVRNPENQRWILIQFPFDYKTKTIGPIEIVEEHTDRIEIVERFKMVAGVKLMSPV
jgi:hypothetical protein